jgi:hypothetical protein
MQVYLTAQMFGLRGVRLRGDQDPSTCIVVSATSGIRPMLELLVRLVGS